MATFRNKLDLLKALFSANAGRTDPFFISIDITRRCNLHCVGCAYHSPHVNKVKMKGYDLPLELATSLAGQLAETNVDNIVIEGAGEPLYHPKVFEILSCFKAQKLPLLLLTNGTLLDREAMIRLIDLNVNQVKISLWASDQKEYEENYPGTDPSKFQSVISSISNFSLLKKATGAKSPSLWLHNPLTRRTGYSASRMVELASDLGCDGISFAPLKSYGGEIDTFVPDDNETADIIRNLKTVQQKAKEVKLQTNIDQVLIRYRYGYNGWLDTPCYIGWIHARIKGNGSVHPCCRCNLPLGNLNEQTFNEIWTGTKFNEFRKSALTKEGLKQLGHACDCQNCPHIHDNRRIQKLFKPFYAKLLKRMS